MPEASFHFPRGFLWGTATAAHQVEGFNSNNQWWEWEQTPGKIIHGDKSGAACDWWNGKWRDDLDRAVENGQNTHRLSIEWSRVQPNIDEWDEDAVDRYIEILRGLVERNLTPFVTLHHFSNPLWLSEFGAWENEESIHYFEEYVRRVVDVLKDYVTYWVTINEPNVYTFLSYLTGDFPPGKKDLFLGVKVLANLVRAHAAAYHAIHEIQPSARVGIAHQYRGAYPASSWSIFDRVGVGLMNDLFNESFPRSLTTGKFRTILGSQRIPQAKDTQDFIGINYYTRDQIHLDLTKPGFIQRDFRPGVDLSDSGSIANEPEGLFEAINWARKFDKPILIMENGLDDSEDILRPRYLIEHIHQIWRAVNENYPVKGYFHWTLVDNFEWERGWSQRFGLWELDPETQTRTKRKSANLYAEIIHENGITADIVGRYTPEILDKIFPS